MKNNFTFIFTLKLNNVNMNKEIRRDLYTQSQYAKLIGVTRMRVNQMIKEDKLNTVTINGSILVKLCQ